MTWMTWRRFPILITAGLLVTAPLAAEGPEAQGEPDVTLNQPEVQRTAAPAAPVVAAKAQARQAARFPNEMRSIDGTGNNVRHPDWGSAGVPFLRLASVAYEDGTAKAAGAELASPREISNACSTQRRPMLSTQRDTAFMWQWGQFLDHDIDLTPVVTPSERLDIPVPQGDLWFDPHSTGTETIPFARSLYTVVDGVRQQMNQITAYIDASAVYGSDAERARTLRTLDGTGRLKTSAGNLLPFNETGLPNAPTSKDTFFLAGDFRANEASGLIAMHTLFVREHNYWARQIARDHRDFSGDEIYEHARAIVAAEMQAITYREFLPVLLGRNALPPYAGYDSRIDAGISNEFATAAYRFGHSQLNGQFLRLDARGREIADGHLPLARAFFAPEEIESHGIDSLLRGLAIGRSEEVDTLLVDDVRNFLFGEPGSGGFDLAALNIQRGRDHGLASYNQTRRDLGLRPARNFADINPDPAVQANLADVYDSVEDVDLWVGGLAEPHRPGALVGETVGVILAEQFRRLRDGDRFWYQAYLPADMVDLVEDQSLNRIIRRNTGIGRELPNNVWRVGGRN